MASTWPRVTSWPTELREHAASLSSYLREVLLRIESAKEQPVPAPLVKSIIAVMYAFINKVDGLPDYNTAIGAQLSSKRDTEALSAQIPPHRLSKISNTISQFAFSSF